jgi:predicted O-methyltransferase YrrM
MTNFEFLNNLYSTRSIVDNYGNEHKFDGAIEHAEAKKLIEVINCHKPKETLEIGLAMGSSALCFLYTKKMNGIHGKHYAIDPNQFSEYYGIGMQLISENNLKDDFVLLQGKTHEIFHNVLERNIHLDMAFIDGWHTFDYTLIDFFFIDKLLNVGGIIAFHDMYGLAKIKVLKYILSHRDYRIMNEHVIIEKNKVKVLKFFIWRVLKKPSLIFSKYFWLFQIKSHYGLIFIQKNSNQEPNFDFYKRF